VNLIWGMTVDESYDDEVKVTVIATWFTSYEENTSLKKPQRDDLGRKLGGSQDFISRSLWGSNNGRSTQQEPEQVQEEQEDYETPAFLRKKI
jgi:cell division GTPase FtsZ